MRKRGLITVAMVSMLILTACSSKEPYYANERPYTKLKDTDYDLDSYDLTDAEKEFVEAFKDCYDNYRKNGPGAPYDYYSIIYDKYDELWKEDQSIEDSEVVKNLRAFCEANKEYEEETKERDKAGDAQAGRINFSYSGPYATEIITFAEDMVGKPAEYLTKEEEQNNYSSLTMEDKVTILKEISGHKMEDRESDLELYSAIYRVSKEHISEILEDPAVIVEAGKKETGKSSTSKTTTEVVEKSPARAQDAWVCAKDIVSSELKSPSTAKYCTYPEATVTKKGDIYTVKGYVDAQNSYGATIRQNFTVTLELTTNGYKNGMATFD